MWSNTALNIGKPFQVAFFLVFSRFGFEFFAFRLSELISAAASKKTTTSVGAQRSVWPCGPRRMGAGNTLLSTQRRNVRREIPNARHKCRGGINWSLDTVSETGLVFSMLSCFMMVCFLLQFFYFPVG
jgi:hypothetical protein